MKNCKEINELVSLYIDDLLENDVRVEFEDHISKCDSCKRELDELIVVVNSCKDISEEELPENFEEELHKKLVNIKNEGDHSSKIVSLRNKYLKICSSIAAILLLAVFAKGFIWNSSLTPAQFSTKSADMAEAGRSDQAYGGIQNQEALLDENKEKSIEKAENRDNKAVNSGSGAVEKPVAPSAKEPVQGKQAPAPEARTGGDVTMKATVAADSSFIINNNTNITITADDITAEEKEIKTYAAAYDTPLPEQNQPVNSVMSLQTSDMNLEDTRVLYFRISNAQYQQFADSIKNNAGSASIEFGSMNFKDATGAIDEADKQLNELNKRIDEIESGGIDSNPGELDQLKTDRENVKAEIDRLKEDSGYTIVTVTIKKKK